MPNRPRPLVAGNWKMNGLRRSLKVLAEVEQGYTPGLRAKADLLVCPPATLVFTAAHALVGSGIAVGGQDCHAKESGAFTGDIAAEMLADAGATFAIVGHSERRQYHGEKDAEVCAKAAAAHRAGLAAIVCVGETQGEREAGKTLAVVRHELRRIVGKAEEASVRILYGGSVKSVYAKELLAVENVDGALVGGASLVAADFLGIAGAYLA